MQEVMNTPEKINTTMPFIIYPTAPTQNSKADLQDYIASNRNSIFDKLYKSGAVLLRDFNLGNQTDFEEVISLITPALKNYIGGDSPRDKLSDSVYTSTNYPPEMYISLHNEKSYSASYPDLIYFFCEIQPLVGGETPILDGRRIYQLLDKNIINNFSKKKLKYVMNLHDGVGFGKSWQDVFETDDRSVVEEILSEFNYRWKDNGMLRIEETVSPIIQHPITLETVFFSQADQWHPSNLDPELLSAMQETIPEEDYYHNCYYGDDSEIDPADLQKIRDLATQELVTFKWKKGDLLIVDNILTLHGRFPFQGPRRILVSMA
jgi:alpha-ketoglutarate-dependent taurine dioxygenase